MRIEQSGHVYQVQPGIDRDDYQAGTHTITWRDSVGRDIVQVLTGRESSLLRLLLDGRKLKLGASIIALFEEV